MRRIKNLLFFTISVSISTVAAAESSWTDKFDLSGDFRFRHEWKKIENTNVDEEDGVRIRQRVRARLKVTSSLSDTLDVGFRLVGGNDNSPTSTNQTNDDEFTSKNVFFDMYYMDWEFGKGLNFIGGKQKYYFHRPAKSESVIDGDVSPEGMTVTWKCQCENGSKFFVNLGSYWLDERNDDNGGAADSFMNVAQVGGLVPAGLVKIGAGVTYFDFLNVKGSAPLTSSGNNTLNGSGNYAFEYKILNPYLEFHFNAGPVPILVYGEFLDNSDADDENQGFTAGFALGKTKKKYDWSFGYLYRETQTDAVFDRINDGDFADGETNSSGHKVKVAYKPADYTTLQLTYFRNRQNKNVDGGTDFETIQANVVAKF